MKNNIKKMLNFFGISISKFNAINIPGYQTAQALKAHNINVVFDVGANIGQFAKELREFGYTGKIVSFEPLQDAHERLLKQAKHDKNWIVHPRCAVGAINGEIEINVAANSASSSILPMLNAHLDAAPDSKYINIQKATLITLDSVLDQYVTSENKLFIKIDTQGYEWAVLDGAKNALKLSEGILIELSLIPLYEGQKLWLDFIKRLRKTKHEIFAIKPAFTDRNNGRSLQIDGVFFKEHGIKQE